MSDVYTTTGASHAFTDDVLVCMTRSEFSLIAHGFFSMARLAMRTEDTSLAETHVRLALDFGRMAYPDDTFITDNWQRIWDAHLTKVKDRTTPKTS